MTTLTLHARGRLPAAEAWERYARPSLWSGWSPQITSVDVPGDRIAVGLRGTVHGPLGLRVRFVITAVDEDARTWTWRPSLGPVTAVLHHEVSAPPPRTAGDAGCATRLRISGSAAVVGAYAPLAQLALLRLVRP